MTAARTMVALVDDDRTYQFTTEHMLRRLDDQIGFRWFRDGEEAMKFLETHIMDTSYLPDVIILDINMPYMDGWQFLDAFHNMKERIGKPIDIYMVSSSMDDRDAIRARSFEEVKDYVEKPITTEKLAAMLQRTHN